MTDTARDGATLIHNAKVYTFDAKDTTAEALLIKGRRIAAIGTREQLQRSIPGAELIDARGATVLPGLIDTHPHLLHFGSLEEPLVRIWDARNHEDIVTRVAARAKAVPAGEWIMTTPVGEPHFFYRRSFKDLQEGSLPSREVLDRASDRHPVVIQAWAPVVPNTIAFNSMALKMLGIDRNTPDQVGKVHVEKDASGEPTGRLHGSVNNYYSFDDFTHKLWMSIPFLQYEHLIPGTKRAIADFHKLGITGIYENHMMDKRLIDAYRDMRKAGELRMRVTASQESESLGMPWSRPRSTETFIARMEDAASAIELEDEYFRFNGLSVMWDGLCSTGMMMMRSPYSGPDGRPTMGKYQTAPEKIEMAMRFCAERRIRLNTMCLGTQAHEENLAMLERLAKTYDIRSLHWLLIHGPFIEPEQARRYKALNFDVTTTMIFCWGKGDLYRKRMGEAALRELMPLRRYFDAGMAVSAATDWGPKSAFEHIQLALTHEFGRSGHRNVGPEQRISRVEAVSMWTRDAAKVLDWPQIGSLAEGSYADLVVVDQDPLTCPVDSIGATKPLLTLFDGTRVHDTGEL